jgi:hypothetical protein
VAHRTGKKRCGARPSVAHPTAAVRRRRRGIVDRTMDGTGAAQIAHSGAVGPSTSQIAPAGMVGDGSLGAGEDIGVLSQMRTISLPLITGCLLRGVVACSRVSVELLTNPDSVLTRAFRVRIMGRWG